MSRTQYGDAVRHAARHTEVFQDLPLLDQKARSAAQIDTTAFAIFVVGAAILEKLHRGQP